MIARQAEHAMQQGDRGGLAVGARDAYQLQLPRGMTVVVCCRFTKGTVAVVHNNISDTIGNFLGDALAEDGDSPRRHRPRDEVVTIDLRAHLRHEEGTSGDLAGVELKVLHFDLCRALQTAFYSF